MISIDLAALAEHLKSQGHGIHINPSNIRIDTENALIWIIRTTGQQHWLVKAVIASPYASSTQRNLGAAIHINPADPDSIEQVEEIIRRYS